MKPEQNNIAELSTRILAMAKTKRVTNDQAESEASERRKRIIQDLREGWGAPKINVTFRPPPEGHWFRTMQLIQSKLGKGVIIGIVGGEGRGKSQMAVECMRHVTGQLRPALYETATGIALRLKATFGGNGTELDVLNALAKPSLLVIDEIDKMKTSGWSESAFFHLINQRFNAMRDTIILGNCKASQLEELLTAYIVARMKQVGGVVECDWPSFRTG